MRLLLERCLRPGGVFVGVVLPRVCPLEIAVFLARGAPKTARLFISVKTVDHHVSAVLGKLGAPTRRDAVAAANRLGLIASDR